MSMPVVVSENVSGVMSGMPLGVMSRVIVLPSSSAILQAS